MIITISATLTQEQIDILASQKGYQETISSFDLNTNELTTVQNTQSKDDFIRQVYEGIIIADATREFLSHSNKQKEAERIAEENSIREQVVQSITSAVV